MSSPPVKQLKLDASQNSVFFTSGDEAESRLSVDLPADSAVDNRLESAAACSQDNDSEVLLQSYFVLSVVILESTILSACS